jgi:hypothetical protein
MCSGYEYRMIRHAKNIHDIYSQLLSLKQISSTRLCEEIDKQLNQGMNAVLPARERKAKARAALQYKRPRNSDGRDLGSPLFLRIRRHM